MIVAVINHNGDIIALKHRTFCYAFDSDVQCEGAEGFYVIYDFKYSRRDSSRDKDCTQT